MEGQSNKIVSIIMVTKGLSAYAETCLASIRRQGIIDDIETIVIDNSLNQHFSRTIKAGYPFVQLYSSTGNLFYCEALNKGINLSSGEFILCLNDDVILEPGFVEEALRGFFVHPQIGMVSGKLLRSDKITIDTTGLFLTIFRTAKDRGYGRFDAGQFEKEGYIFGVNGAAAFYRRKMLEDVKEGKFYLDPSFNIFYEDLDIAWRAERNGWGGYYTPLAVACHMRGGTVRRPLGIDKPYARVYLDERLHFDLIKNRYLSIIKNESLLSFLLHLPATALYDIVAWFYIILFKPRLIKMLILNFSLFSCALKRRFSILRREKDKKAYEK